VTFVFDHDVPDEVALVLHRRSHEVILLRTMLPITSPDAEVFAYARQQKLILVTCNRNHFLELAVGTEHPGLIVLIRRRTRQDEASRLLRLIENAGEPGLRGNINFA
jgi:predicted nuclease of predicted toxin-antitoxin system